MISSIEGKLEYIGPDYVILNTNGVGFKIMTPAPAFLANGQTVKLYTYLSVREDALVLFGFKTMSDLDLFQILINVNGVGPKLGLSMLATYDSKTLTTAIINGNESMLTSISGLGKKTAARIIVDLKDKVAEKWIGEVDTESTSNYDKDVVDALMALGYSASEAAYAVSTLPKDNNLSLEEKIRISLNSFNK